MPLPKPNDGESHDKFMDRCMANPTMNSEYPDNKQRYAVCQAQWDKDNKAAEDPTIERRFVQHAELAIEQREDKGESGRLPYLRGYAALFDTLTELWPGMSERIAPGAFTRTLAEKADVRALVDHDPSKILARTKSGTLRLDENSKGLKVLIKPGNTSIGRDTVTSIERGDLDQMSFAFRVKEEEFIHHDDGTYERVVEDVDLFDVSVVTYPAYPTTNVELVKRSFEARCKKPAAEPARTRPEVNPIHEDIVQLLHEQKILETKYGRPTH